VAEPLAARIAKIWLKNGTMDVDNNRQESARQPPEPDSTELNQALALSFD
jgi:hypothetical protein